MLVFSSDKGRCILGIKWLRVSMTVEIVTRQEAVWKLIIEIDRQPDRMRRAPNARKITVLQNLTCKQCLADCLRHFHFGSSMISHGHGDIFWFSDFSIDSGPLILFIEPSASSSFISKSVSFRVIFEISSSGIYHAMTPFSNPQS